MKYLLLTLMILTLAACAAAGEGARTVLEPLVKDGKITKEQLDLVVDVLSGKGGIDWGYLLSAVGEGALTLITGYLGITMWRGSPNKRKGSAPQ